jgi:hypothetical protein
MLTDYSKIKPKSLSRLATQSFWIPTTSGLSAYMKQRKLLSNIRISSSKRQNSTQKYSFRLNYNKVHTPLLNLQMPIFKHNSTVTIAEQALSSKVYPVRNQCKQTIDTNAVPNIFSLHFSSISKQMAYRPVINNDIHVMGRKMRLHNDSSALRYKDKESKLNYTIEPVKPYNCTHQKYENCLSTLPQNDDDDSYSDISAVKLESKYNEFIPYIQPVTQIQPKKKKMKRKKHKSLKQ